MEEPRHAERRRRQGRARIPILVTVGAIVAIVVLAIVVDAAVYNSKIHAGVSIAGHSVGGSTRNEATAQLTALAAKAQESKITLTSGAKSWELKPTDVGTKFDVEGAVSAAMAASRDGNFFTDLGHRLKLYFSGVDVPLKGTVDSAKMDKYLTDLATELDIAPVNARLTFENGDVKAVEGKSGTAVEKDKLKQELEAVLLTQHSTEIAIPMTEQQPAVQAQDMQEAVDQGHAMLSAPVTLAFKDKSWTITTVQIGTFMDFTSKDVGGVSTLQPYLSADKMKTFLDSISPDVATDPVGATFESDGTKAWVVAGVEGAKLDPDKTAEALTTAALRTTGRSAQVAVTTADPKLTTEAAKAMGVTDLLASYTTPSYVGTTNRQVNVRITTEYASNVFLAPGQIYDFDKQIGRRTEARGYKLAKGIVGGGVLEDVLGGGICQVSTTLFNAVFEAGLEVVERWNHSIYIDHYPPGRDATVTAGGKNFRFKNDTAHYIWIRGNSDGITTVFNIYGTDDGRTVKPTFSGFHYGAARTEVTVLDPSLTPGQKVVKVGGQSARSCTVTRIVRAADGTVIHKDVFGSDWEMIPRQIEVGPSTTTTTVPVSTTTTSTTKPPSSTSTTAF